MSRFTRIVVALGALRGLRKQERERRRQERIVEPGEAKPRAELVVVGLLMLCALFAVAFLVIYAIDGIGSKTQFEGLTLGGAFIFLSAAFIVISKQVVVTEQ